MFFLRKITFLFYFCLFLYLPASFSMKDQQPTVIKFADMDDLKKIKNIQNYSKQVKKAIQNNEEVIIKIGTSLTIFFEINKVTLKTNNDIIIFDKQNLSNNEKEKITRFVTTIDPIAIDFYSIYDLFLKKNELIRFFIDYVIRLFLNNDNDKIILNKYAQEYKEYKNSFVFFIENFINTSDANISLSYKNLLSTEDFYDLFNHLKACNPFITFYMTLNFQHV